jgi:hypothetical protein
MTEEKLIELAKFNLERVLSFFPRVDTLLSVILAINISLVAVIASNAPSVRLLDWYSLIALFFLMLIIISFYHLYKCAFPRLDGEENSLIYFSEIANIKQLQYCEKFKQQTEEDYLDDLIKQVWRNSEILKEKFYHLQLAFIFLLFSLLFWLPSLMIFISKNTQSFLAK